jgi:hypothetical protein
MKKKFIIVLIPIIVIVLGTLFYINKANKHIVSNNTTTNKVASVNNIYTGPYAEDFKQIADMHPAKITYNIIKDEKITLSELNDLINLYKKCLTNMGYKVSVDLKGNQSIKPSAHIKDRNTLSNDSEMCDKKYAFTDVQSLYWDIKGNPNNLDFEKIMTECLIRNKMVPNDYTKEDWRNDFYNGTGILEKYVGANATRDNQDKYMNCQYNPLTYGIKKK